MMKRSKPQNSSKAALPQSREIRSVRELRDFQRLMAGTLFLPLTATERLKPRTPDGRRMSDVAAGFIKPNDRLTSFERLEIYSRSYWFRLLNAFHEDFPGLRAVLGRRAFGRLAEAYLVRYPSVSFTLRDLGSRLEKFLREEPGWAGRRFDLALDVARFEWAQVVAFDGEARAAIKPDDLKGADPSKFKPGLQPYLTLLECNYPVDDYMVAVKKDGALRNEASNTKTSSPAEARRKKIATPKRQQVHIAVHRYDNTVYFKRLEPEAFILLTALRKGATIERACVRALRDAAPGIDWAEKIGAWFANWSALGWFCQKS